MDDYSSNVAFISAKLSYTEALAQLAEDAAELAQAALKLRRAIGTGNPTPVPMAEAKASLEEEMSDVLLCLIVTGTLAKDKKSAMKDMIKEKARRWALRLAQ